MHTKQDKIDFSERLKTAIRLAGLDNLSNASLANRFNLRHPNQSVSTQAFHHWLVGRSIPTPDKIETLAKWLDTSGEWLRHGRMLEEGGAVSPQEALLLKYFRALSPEKQEALITLLHKAEDWVFITKRSSENHFSWFSDDLCSLYIKAIRGNQIY